MVVIHHKVFKRNSFFSMPFSRFLCHHAHEWVGASIDDGGGNDDNDSDDNKLYKIYASLRNVHPSNKATRQHKRQHCRCSNGYCYCCYGFHFIHNFCVIVFVAHPLHTGKLEPRSMAGWNLNNIQSIVSCSLNNTFEIHSTVVFVFVFRIVLYRFFVCSIFLLSLVSKYC